MFVICMNDYPIATADTEQTASEARAYIQRLYDLVNKASYEHGGMVCIHVREVPTVISNVGQYHRLFLSSGGSQYQWLLNILSSKNPVFIRNQDDAMQMFKDFRKTYPAIGEFIVRANEGPSFKDEFIQVSLDTSEERIRILCSCGKVATRTYTDTQSGIVGKKCSDCYDIETCQDAGYAETGESYSTEEAIEILKMGGWTPSIEED